MSETVHNEEFKLIIATPANKFEKHLALPNNKRIIFSGIYGCGKTYFLKEYFSDFKPNPNVIHIFPNNYAVARNEDVFEYLKHDILFELFGKDIDFEKVDFSKLSTLQSFLFNAPSDLFTPFLEVIPKVGKSLSAIIKAVDKFGKEYVKYRSELNIDQEQEIKEYIEEFNLHKGSIYEENYYTQIISELLDLLKEKHKQETILIIDDLDRLDPDHIFRLLNVFAAHIQFLDDENKFGFDKIILVFDYENVRNVFHNRYGKNVDFPGYIDKFYSYEVFNFNNKEIILENLDNILNKIDLSEISGISIRFERTDKNYFAAFVHFIISELITLDLINLRTLLRLINYKYKIEPKSIDFKMKNGQDHRKSNWDFPLIMVFDFIINLFGSVNALETVFKTCSQKSLPKTEYETEHIKNQLIGSAIILIDYKQHEFSRDDNEFTFSSELLEVNINYSLHIISKFRNYFVGQSTSIYKLGDDISNSVTCPEIGLQ